jgi:hypothetical protein
LSVDALDPWGGYSSVGGILRDIHDGRWYQSSYKAFCEETPNHGNFCYSPLIGYIDKTGTDGVMKNTLEPWMWISTNIRQNKREDRSCWFPGGCTNSRSATVRDYHRCLEVLSQPLKDLKRDTPFMYIQRGDQIMYYQHI